MSSVAVVKHLELSVNVISPTNTCSLENQTQYVQTDSDCYCNTTSTAIEESQEMDLISGDIARICINDCRIDDWVVVLYDEKRYLGERKDISLHDAEFYVSVHVSRK